MKNNKNRFLLALLILMTFALLAACGKKDAKEEKKNDENTSSEYLSRAEYIGFIGEAFGYEDYETSKSIFEDVSSSDKYYPYIQACSEWEVIEKTGKFNPDSSVTLKYALETAVKAVGEERLAKSGAVISKDDYVSFYTSHIAKIDVSDPDKKLNADTAALIVKYAVDFRNNLEFPQVYNTELKSDVKKAEGGVLLNYDGETGILDNASAYKTGDILYWEDSETSAPTAVKITKLDGNNFTYTVPDIYDVYESIEISGTYDGTVREVTSASDGTVAGFGKSLYDEVKGYGMAYNPVHGSDIMQLANGVKTEYGKDYIRFAASSDAKADSGKTHAEFVAEIKNIKVTIDYKSSGFTSLESISANVSFDTNVSSNVTGVFSKSIPLGEAWIDVIGPVQLRLVFTAHIGANGEITVAYTTENVLDAGWEKGKGFQKSFSSTPSFKFEAEATVTAEVNTLADLVIGFRVFGHNISKSMINAEVTVGLVAIAKADGDLLDKEPVCTDVLVYVPLRWGINQRACILTDIKSDLKYKKTVWDSETSEFKLHLHFENGERTPDDKCTRGSDKEIVQKDVDESGNPFDELDLFDFELIDFDFIKTEKSVIFLDEKESASIKFISLPDGYKSSDIRYEVENTSVCRINDGNITALKPGSTLVKIKTSDGMYTTSLAVTVFENYSVSGFEPLQ